LAVVAACIVGCSADPSAPPPSGSPAASPVAGDVCAPIDLRTPDGQPLDLNGQWRSNHDGAYLFSQGGSCLFWLGQSTAAGGSPAGTLWTQVFSGGIRSDFSIAGAWSDVPGGTENHGRLELAIEFFSQGGRTWPLLRLIDHQPPTIGPGGAYPSEYADGRWQPEETISGPATYIGTIGVDPPHCPWLDVDGQRYELTGLVEIQGDHVIGKRGVGVGIQEQARVEGRLGQAIGPEGCAPSAIVVLDIESEP
jgi:hypothetical protein